MSIISIFPTFIYMLYVTSVIRSNSFCSVESLLLDQNFKTGSLENKIYSEDLIVSSSLPDGSLTLYGIELTISNIQFKGAASLILNLSLSSESSVSIIRNSFEDGNIQFLDRALSDGSKLIFQSNEKTCGRSGSDCVGNFLTFRSNSLSNGSRISLVNNTVAAYNVMGGSQLALAAAVIQWDSCFSRGPNVNTIEYVGNSFAAIGRTVSSTAEFISVISYQMKEKVMSRMQWVYRDNHLKVEANGVGNTGNGGKGICISIVQMNIQEAELILYSNNTFHARATGEQWTAVGIETHGLHLSTIEKFNLEGNVFDVDGETGGTCIEDFNGNLTNIGRVQFLNNNFTCLSSDPTSSKSQGLASVNGILQNISIWRAVNNSFHVVGTGITLSGDATGISFKMAKISNIKKMKFLQNTIVTKVKGNLGEARFVSFQFNELLNMNIFYVENNFTRIDDGRSIDFQQDTGRTNVVTLFRCNTENGVRNSDFGLNPSKINVFSTCGSCQLPIDCFAEGTEKMGRVGSSCHCECRNSSSMDNPYVPPMCEPSFFVLFIEPSKEVRPLPSITHPSGPSTQSISLVPKEQERSSVTLLPLNKTEEASFIEVSKTQHIPVESSRTTQVQNASVGSTFIDNSTIVNKTQVDVAANSPLPTTAANSNNETGAPFTKPLRSTPAPHGPSTKILTTVMSENLADVTTTSGTVGGITSSLVSSPIAAGQVIRGNLMLQLAYCHFNPSSSPSVVELPIRWPFEDSENGTSTAAYENAVFSTSFLCVLVPTIFTHVYAYYVATQKLSKGSCSFAFTRLVCANIYAIIIAYFVPAIVKGITVIFLHEGRKLYGFLSLVLILLSLLPAFNAIMVSEEFLGSRFEIKRTIFPQRPMNKIKLHYENKIDRSSSSALQFPWIEMYNPLFDANKDPTRTIVRFYFVEDLLMSILSAVVAGIQPSVGSSCVPSSAVTLGFVVLHLAYLLIVRPFIFYREVIFTFLLGLVMVAISCTIMLLHILPSTSSSSIFTVLAFLDLIFNGLFVLQTFVSLVMAISSHEKNKQLEAEQQKEKDGGKQKDGDGGISMEEIWIVNSPTVHAVRKDLRVVHQKIDPETRRWEEINLQTAKSNDDVAMLAVVPSSSPLSVNPLSKVES